MRKGYLSYSQAQPYNGFRVSGLFECAHELIWRDGIRPSTGPGCLFSCRTVAPVKTRRFDPVVSAGPSLASCRLQRLLFPHPGLPFRAGMHNPLATSEKEIRVSSIPVRPGPGIGLLPFEENHSPISSSSRTCGEPPVTARPHRDHAYRCGIRPEW